MPMTETQALNFMSRVKTYYIRVMDSVEPLQSTALVLSQEVGAHGGIPAITSAIPDETWNATYPFSKQEFGTIAGDFSELSDVLGEHGDLKPSLVQLRE